MFSHCRCVFSSRQPVGFFNVENFRPKRSFRATASNVASLLREHVNPSYKLIRQASSGTAATRFLVVDEKNLVCGIYRPVLCKPFPIHGDIMGLPVEDYLSSIDKDASRVFVTFSHPNGLAMMVLSSDGDVAIDAHNFHVTAKRSNGRNFNAFASDMSIPTHASILADVFEYSGNVYEEGISTCNTFYYFTTVGACVSHKLLAATQALQQREASVGFDSSFFDDTQDEQRESDRYRFQQDQRCVPTVTTPLSFQDSRWVLLRAERLVDNPTQLLTVNTENGLLEVNEKRLVDRMTIGGLFLDY